LLEEGMTVLQAIGLGVFEAPGFTDLGEACLLGDRREDALRFAERAVRLTRERGQRGYEAWALWLLGEIASHSDPPDVGAAEGHYRQAMALAEELGMRPLLAHCRLGLGKLYRRKGPLQQAQEHLTTAMTMYREMDMRFWLEQGEAEQKRLG
jgi:tetratricopeptide (TPR) repeat protein